MSGEQRMLIDGELVEAEGGVLFDNINPATEEVLGQAADGTTADMERAVAAARRAFDRTDWATDHEGRQASIRQLQSAIEGEQEELRAELIAEVGAPLLSTYGPQLDAPLREALLWPAEMIDEYPWSRSIGAKDALGIGFETEREVWKEPIGVVGVIVPWTFPIEILLNKLGPILAMDSPTEFQFLLPAGEKDPDRKMHEYLRREFLGIPQGKFAPGDSALGSNGLSLVE